MTLNDLTALVVDTLRDPRATAERLIAQDIGMPTLWAGLALAAVLNALLVGVNLMLFPNAAFPLPALLLNPVIYAVMMAAGLAFSIFVLTWVGGKMGGQGALQDVAVLLIWLQYLRLVAQLVLLVLTLVIPVLAIIATLAVALYSFWLLLTFLDVAHRLGSLGKSALVLVFSFLGVIFALSMLLTLIGVPTPEMS
ncbi:MAG: YIP1 family protein [Rhodobacterales bacterium]